MDIKGYGVVYVIYNPDMDIVKLGRSTRVDKRLSVLSTGCGSDLIIIYTTPPLSNFVDIELLSHEKFKDKRLVGEWFQISYAEAALFMSKQVISDKIHPLVDMYKNGMSIADLSIFYNVSRAYIMKLLKNWNIYKPKSNFDLVKGSLVLEKKKLSIIPTIENKRKMPFFRSVKFRRVGVNLYKHPKEEIYKTTQIIDKKIVEEYFLSKEDAENFLNKQ